MGQSWTVDAPRTIDIGEEGEVVQALHLTRFDGKVSVLAHDEPTAVVEVTVLIDAPPVQVAWDGTTLTLAQEKQQRSLRQRLTGLRSRARAEVVLTIPRECRSTLESVNGAVLVTGVDGDVETRATNGSLTVARLGGDLRVDGANGSVAATGIRGRVAAHRLNGSATLTEVAGPEVVLGQANGSLVLDLAPEVEACHVFAEAVNGSLTVRAPQLPVDARSRASNGSLVVDRQTAPLLVGAPGGIQRQHSEPGARLVVETSRINGSTTVLRRDPLPAADAPGQEVPR